MLENYITLTSTVRLRFGAADGPSAGNIIEAALDNVKVWAYGGCETNEDCDDGLFCNGAETCVSGICQAGTPPDCSDGVNCTDDSCNEVTDSCDHTANDSLCDNGLFCDGAETCDAQLGCQAGSNPCSGQYCDETGDTCYECETDPECDDGLFCNGTETCVSGQCQSGTPPDCNDGVSCTVDSCNEDTDSCDHIPSDSLCYNGLFCDGIETCDTILGCQPGSDPCNGGACDEGNDSCVECGNEICETPFEHCSNCPQDCPGDGFKGECCGNGVCEKFEEKKGTCPEDCG